MRRDVVVSGRSAEHFVIVRIGVMRRGSLPPHGWLEGRGGLFERFTAPSLNAQTTRDFTVLLLLDEARCPDWSGHFLRHLKVPAEVLPTGVRWKDAVSRRLARRSTADVVTTTLDSDDGIAVDFVHQVQERIRPDRGLNFVDGVQLRLSDGRLAHRRKYSNPFCSMHSSSGDWVLRGSGHKKFASRYPVDDVEGELMWLQVVHGGNVSNAFSEHARPLSPRDVRPRLILPEDSTWSHSQFQHARLQLRFRELGSVRTLRAAGAIVLAAASKGTPTGAETASAD